MWESNQAQRDLKRLPGRADKIAQNGDVRAIRADTSGIHRQAQTLGKVQIHTGIIELGQAEPGSRKHAIESRGIDGAWRAATLPGAARQLIKLLPIAFVPSRHFYFVLRSLQPLGCTSSPEGSLSSGTSLSLRGRKPVRPVALIAARPPGRQHTSQLARRNLFLVYCFKHFNGRFVALLARRATTQSRYIWPGR